MIFISGDVVLSDQSGDLRPNAPLIGYRTVITFDNVGADEEADGFPVTNLSNGSTAELWKGETAMEQHITISLGVPVTADYIGIARHNLGTAGIMIQVQVSEDGVTWTDHGDDIAPADDTALMLRFPGVESQYFRIKLSAGTDPPQMAVLYLGELLVLQRNIYGGHTPINYSYDNVSSVGVSESGQYLGAVARRANPSTKIEQKNLTAAWARSDLDPFFTEAVGNGTTKYRTPFFFAWRPTTYPTEVGYGWIPPGSSPTWANQGKGIPMVDASFDVQAVL